MNGSTTEIRVEIMEDKLPAPEAERGCIHAPKTKGFQRKVVCLESRDLRRGRKGRVDGQQVKIGSWYRCEGMTERGAGTRPEEPCKRDIGMAGKSTIRNEEGVKRTETHRRVRKAVELPSRSLNVKDTWPCTENGYG